MMTPSPSREINTADHTHVGIFVTNPRRRSLPQLVIFELEQRQLQQ